MPEVVIIRMYLPSLVMQNYLVPKVLQYIHVLTNVTSAIKMSVT